MGGEVSPWWTQLVHSLGTGTPDLRGIVKPGATTALLGGEFMVTVTRRTFGRRALFAMTLGASLGALSGCRTARTVQAAPSTQAAGRSVQQLTVGDC